jgi:uncharacterized membrane protein
VDGVKETVARIIEAAALGIEVLAVIVIVCAVLFGTWRFVLHGRHDGAAGFRNYKQHLTKGLLLGLEFLVAGDIVRTVAIDTTLTNVAVLGALVVVRTVLSWSLIVEMDGRWPWKAGNTNVIREES